VGELYQAIRRAFETMDEAAQFIAQDQDDSWGGVDVSPARNRHEAVAAIDVVVAEGEGTPAAGPSSHYQTFLGISRELGQLRHDHPQFDPARAVVPNPMSRRHRDNQGRGTLLGEPFTRAVSELLNALYVSLLRILAQYYSYAGESASQRATLQDVAVDLMYGVIRPLGVALTRLPADPATPGLTAGPSFEIYSPLGLPRDLHLAARIVLERLVEEAQEALRLEQLSGIATPAAAALKRSAATADAAAASIRQEFQL
jgi:hypothetical protein